MEEEQDVERKEPPRGGSRRSTVIRYSPEEKLKAVRLVLEDGTRLAVGCTAAGAGLWVSLVAMSSSCPTRICLNPRVHSLALTSGGQEVVVCGLSETLDPFRFPYFGAVSIQGQLPLLPLVLVVFRGYASIGPLPDQLQASIPSAGLALTRGAYCPLISYSCQAATGQYEV
jgi:hypothetical protein